MCVYVHVCVCVCTVCVCTVCVCVYLCVCTCMYSMCVRMSICVCVFDGDRGEGGEGYIAIGLIILKDIAPHNLNTSSSIYSSVYLLLS